MLDITTPSLQLAPNYPRLQNADGSLNWEPNVSGTSTITTHPLKPLLATYSAKTHNLTTNLVLKYKVSSNFEIKSSFGYTKMQINEVSLSNPSNDCSA